MKATLSKTEIIESNWVYYIENIVGTAEVYGTYTLHNPAYPGAPAQYNDGCWGHGFHVSLGDRYEATERDFWRWWGTSHGKSFKTFEIHKLYSIDGESFDADKLKRK